MTDDQLTLEGDVADHDRVPSRDEFIEDGILGYGESEIEWVYLEEDDQAYRLIDYEEVHKWHFAAVLANPDGTYAKLHTFHDSDDYHLVIYSDEELHRERKKILSSRDE